jgi:hypothetical protein
MFVFILLKGLLFPCSFFPQQKQGKSKGGKRQKLRQKAKIKAKGKREAEVKYLFLKFKG